MMGKISVAYVDYGKSIKMNTKTIKQINLIGPELSPREEKIMSILKRKKVVPPDDFDTLDLKGNALELAISRLRRKIAPDKIVAHYGRGYRLERA